MKVRGDFLGPPQGTNTTALICKVDKTFMIFQAFFKRDFAVEMLYNIVIFFTVRRYHLSAVRLNKLFSFLKCMFSFRK